MAVFNRLTQKQIEDNYTHYASLHGVPIYFNNNGFGNGVCVRNFYPEFLLDVMEQLFNGFVFISSIINSDYEPMYPIKLIKEIKPTS
jgi:hypothetical protein